MYSNIHFQIILTLAFFVFGGSHALCQDAPKAAAANDGGVFALKKSFKELQSSQFIIDGGSSQIVTIFKTPTEQDRTRDLKRKFDPQKNVLWVSFKHNMSYKQLVEIVDSLKGIETLVLESTIYPELTPDNKFRSAIRSSLSDKWIDKLKQKFPKLKIKRSASIEPRPRSLACVPTGNVIV